MGAIFMGGGVVFDPHNNDPIKFYDYKTLFRLHLCLSEKETDLQKIIPFPALPQILQILFRTNTNGFQVNLPLINLPPWLSYLPPLWTHIANNYCRFP